MVSLSMSKNNEVFVQSVSDDRSTDDVIQWLYHLNNKIKITPIFDVHSIKKIDVKISNKSKIEIDTEGVNLNSNSYFWYRRGKFNFDFANSKILNINMYEDNIKPILEFVNNGFSRNSINKFNDNFKEKLEMLQASIDLGLNIPDALITSDAIELNKFIKKYKKVIAKPISNPSHTVEFEKNKFSIGNQTKLLTVEDVNGNHFEFLPSFFQKYIEKKFEIRSFYLKGKFKSMAIFSQQNEKTKIDFRNYDYVRPNRCVPYYLPKSLEKKLHKLMLKLDINCGSFDLIFTPSGKYYFLEVNPIGQFQWLSQNCNYYIERMISENLINTEYE